MKMVVEFDNHNWAYLQNADTLYLTAEIEPGRVKKIDIKSIDDVDKRFTVGDEVFVDRGGNNTFVISYIHSCSNQVNGIDGHGNYFINKSMSELHKTGRHFNQLIDMFTKMEENA